MKKKLVILCLSVFIFLFIGINNYRQKNKTIECWWGVLYPNLSFIGFENTEDKEDETKISALDKNYIYTNNHNEDEIKYKLAIVEWINSLFSF